MIKYFYFFIFLSFSVFGDDKSICGTKDDRDFSTNKKVGRVNDGLTSVCTVTLIGKRCALTACHCHSILNEVSFNVPKSINGQLGLADSKDIYQVDRYETFFANNGAGDDYAVLKLIANKITGKLPGEVQGYYEVGFERVKVGDEVTITGFGKDTRLHRNHSQQTHRASIVSLFQNMIQHNVDTRFGNSGSVIIDDVTKKVIGIHTHGACYPGGGSNFGTSIHGNIRLKNGIKNCLAEDF